MCAKQKIQPTSKRGNTAKLTVSSRDNLLKLKKELKAAKADFKNAEKELYYAKWRYFYAARMVSQLQKKILISQQRD